LYQSFFSEANTSKSAALAKYNHNKVARLFVLKAISSHMQTKCAGEFNWYLTVVRDAQDLTTEASFDFEAGQIAPLLFDSGALALWPYQGGGFYVCDNLATSIAVWFCLCERHYRHVICHGAHDMRPFADELEASALRAQQGAESSGGATWFV
jgi:hypothetical protein